MAFCLLIHSCFLVRTSRIALLGLSSGFRKS
jgi:hypothetical protein